MTYTDNIVQIIEDASLSTDAYEIRRDGQPVAVVIGWDHYQDLLAELRSPMRRAR